MSLHMLPKKLNSEDIAAGHLLLGLLREEQSFAAEILAQYVLKPDEIRREIEEHPFEG